MNHARSRKAGIVAALVLMGTVLLLGLTTAGDNVLRVDVEIATAIQRWQGGEPNALQQIGDAIGGTIGAIVVATAILLLCLVKHWKPELIMATVTILLRLAALGLKPVFDSPRPTAEHVQLLRTYHHYGYPSGHAMTAMMIACLLVLITWRRSTSIANRSAIVVLAMLIAGVTGWSRVWAGAHWPTDVLGGWLFGAGLVLLASAMVTRQTASPGSQGQH